MTPAGLRIPLASLPGFDPIGLWIHLASGVTEICYGLDDKTREPFYYDNDGRGFESTAPGNVDLDLADSATRDRVARWVAGRVGLVVGLTAPSFRPAHALGLRTWEMWTWNCLTPENLEMAWFSAAWKRDEDGKYLVPTLADLDPTDPTLLPDGSRQVDAVALGRVAVHLGSQP